MEVDIELGERQLLVGPKHFDQDISILWSQAD